MKLTVIVCAFNERTTIETVLDRIQAVDFGSDWSLEVLVVDNCSTDGTRDISYGRVNGRILVPYSILRIWGRVVRSAELLAK